MKRIASIVASNPFRVVGLKATATQREIEKQKSKAASYARLGREVEGDFEPALALPSVSRSEQDLVQAFAKLQQGSERVRHALFWFVDISPVDGVALDRLAEGGEGIVAARQVWEKLAQRELAASTYPAYLNLSTLLMALGEELAWAVDLKFSVIQSPFFPQFVRRVSDASTSVDPQEYMVWMVQQLSQGVGTSLLAARSLFDACGEEVQALALSQLVDEPIANAGRLVEVCKAKRGQDPLAAGRELEREALATLRKLGELMGRNTLKWRKLSDAVAKELIQCGVDAAAERGSGEQELKAAYALIEKAQQVSTDPKTKERAKEQLEELGNRIEALPAAEYVERVKKSLERYRKANLEMDSVCQLAREAIPPLRMIEGVLGKGNGMLISLASAVTMASLSRMIDLVNIHQKALSELALESPFGLDRSLFEPLKEIISQSLGVFKVLTTLPMVPHVREHFSKNYTVLQSLASQFGCLARPLRIDTIAKTAQPARKVQTSPHTTTTTTSNRVNGQPSHSAKDVEDRDVRRKRIGCVVFLIILAFALMLLISVR